MAPSLATSIWSTAQSKKEDLSRRVEDCLREVAQLRDRWLRKQREEAYSDWLAWIIEQLVSRRWRYSTFRNLYRNDFDDSFSHRRVAAKSVPKAHLLLVTQRARLEKSISHLSPSPFWAAPSSSPAVSLAQLGTPLLKDMTRTSIRMDSTGATACCSDRRPMPCESLGRGIRPAKAGHDQQYENEGNV
jgi:hypothetical protein